MMTGPTAPVLSVVVTVVDGGAALERCLAALRAQSEAAVLDVVVPCDRTAAAAAGVAARFAGVLVLDLGDIPTRHPVATPAGQHELYDRRRAAGLAAARGALVAIVEDRGVPEPEWARALIRLHEQLPYPVIGGAVTNARPALLNRAVFLCDFARYEPPFDAGPRDYVTDVNVCYKRAALERTRALWQEGYHETVVHDALRRAGEVLHLSPEPVVREQRDGLRLGALLAERLAWARQFAATRARDSSPAARVVRVAVSPLLPLVLWWRIVRRSAPRGGLHLLPVSPVLLLLLSAWVVGEMLGDITGHA